MQYRVFDFYVPEGKRGQSARYRISTHEQSQRRPLSMAIVVLRNGDEAHIGISFCSPEDTFDIRVGVPLALKRALRDFKHANRTAIMREFFKCWPEAHPYYKVPVKPTCPHSIIDNYGHDIRIHCPSCVTQCP